MIWLTRLQFFEVPPLIMLRVIVFAALTLMTAFGPRGCDVCADEIVIGNRPDQRSLADLGLDKISKPNNSRLITAGELWQFFHDQGVTSVDQLTLNLDCGGKNLSHSGAIQFQIQDPNNGNILTNLSIDSSSNRLEVPLEFDYMKRFSPGSKELIRLDLSELDALASKAKISVESDSQIFGPLNVLLITGFFAFWVVVFFVLNRLTKPIQQEGTEDIVVHSANSERSNVEALAPQGSSNGQARVHTAITLTSTGARPGQSKMVSAQ